jgi:RNA polymerase sigma factor (sigma-70 family)
MDTDAALANRLARDLDGAFPILVANHADRLYTIALRLLGDRRDAEEVAQDALTRAYRAMGGYSRERIEAMKLRPWLASIAINLARNRRRRIDDRQPPAQLEPMLDGGYDPPSDARWASPASTADRRETQRELAEALLRLNVTVRAAVVLRHVDGLSLAETAEALGRPEGTIKAQVHRGLQQLRAILEERGGAAAATTPATPPISTDRSKHAARLMPAMEAIR